MGKSRVSTIRAIESTDAKSHVSQIASQLKTAKELALIKEARQDHSGLQTSISGRPEIQANRHAVTQLIERQVARIGMDTAKFDEILFRNQSELRRIADEQKMAAIQQSSAMLKTFYQNIETKRHDLNAVIAAAEEPAPILNYLEAPFLIWPTQGLELLDSQVTPFHSMGKVTLDSGDTWGSQSLGFYYLWENPSDRYAVINISAWLFFSGQLRAAQGGGFWPGDRFARINAEGRLHVFEWWNNPPTEAPQQLGQIQQVGSVETVGGGFGDVGAIETSNVFRTVDLQHTHFLMPPHAVTVIEVTPTFNFSTGSDSGHVNADFNSGDFQLMSPFVTIGILT